MTGKKKSTPPFDIYMPENNVLCAITPASLGAPAEELDMEAEAGLDVLLELSTILARVANNGPLVEPSYPPFPHTEVYPDAILYMVMFNGDVNWYRNAESSKPDGSTEWIGPRRVQQQWDDYIRFFNAGWEATYYIDATGDLYGISHNGIQQGSPEWGGPKRVGRGWNSFKEVFSCGEHIICGIDPAGRLLWYNHKGAPFGDTADDWVGYREVGTGWQNFQQVFSGGGGIIYAIRQDGVLVRYHHKGYLDGTPDWGQSREIGTGWHTFKHVVASPDGVFYAFTADGRVLWYRYGTRSTSLLDYVPGRGWVPVPRVIPEYWEGPVTVLRGVPACRAVFAALAEPYVGPH